MIAPIYTQVLEQRFHHVERERDELYEKFESTIYDVQQKSGFKNILLERKLQAINERVRVRVGVRVRVRVRVRFSLPWHCGRGPSPSSCSLGCACPPPAVASSPRWRAPAVARDAW